MKGLRDPSRNAPHILFAHPACGGCRSANPDAAGPQRRVRVIWDDLFVGGDADLFQGLLSLLAVESETRNGIGHHHVIAGATGDQFYACLGQRLRQSLGIGQRLACVVLKRGLRGLPEGDRRGRNAVHVRPALQARKY